MRLLLPLVLFCISQTGCMLFGSGHAKTDSNLLPQKTGQSFTVMMKGSKPVTLEITEGLTVQDAVEMSGAKRKYGDMSIVIKRVIPGKHLRHKLKVDFDAGKKRVPYDQDYSIYPNDIVLIAPESSVPLEKVADIFSGVFGR